MRFQVVKPLRRSHLNEETISLQPLSLLQKVNRCGLIAAGT